MSELIKTIINKDGNIVLPKTKSTAIYMENEQTLEEVAGILYDITSTATELNILDGATITTAELNYCDGVTSAIQTQLNGKSPLVASHSDVADTYQLALADANTRITATKSTGFTITIPLNATVPGFVVGDTIEVIQYGAGAITIAIEATGTLLSKGSKVITDGQYSVVTVTKMATDTWLLVGALA